MISLISISLLIVILVDRCNRNVGNKLKAVVALHLKMSSYIQSKSVINSLKAVAKRFLDNQ